MDYKVTSYYLFSKHHKSSVGTLESRYLTYLHLVAESEARNVEIDENEEKGETSRRYRWLFLCCPQCFRRALERLAMRAIHTWLVLSPRLFVDLICMRQ